jgi:hypothetical protein
VRVQRWINTMWVDKDAGLDALLAGGGTIPATSG